MPRRWLLLNIIALWVDQSQMHSRRRGGRERGRERAGVLLRAAGRFAEIIFVRVPHKTYTVLTKITDKTTDSIIVAEYFEG